MTIADLIERLEKEGPSRELDAAIFSNFAERGQRYWNFKGCRQRGEDEAVTWAAYCDRCAPHYTSSIDSALTLVPEGWRWKVAERRAGDFVGTVIQRQDMEHINHDVKASEREARAEANVRYGIAPTAALALCIAALKARAGGVK